MEIIETKIFTQRICELLTDEQYTELQNHLAENPNSGDVIKGSGGLRKLRWKLQGTGKSGGIRNIYYHYEDKHQIFMIYVYQKSKQTDLTPNQIQLLRKQFLGE
ncbi:MAG: type II toxin-antitoxin system RelE/ParE family toxin [Helicobacteraceae bacterium]|nr:type II toxin-antitoxin system RelE/ParE family toxin [Candidatus Sulfurimonas ponti]MBL6973401.1 type II toxin-antitoxin system RelE/ParE family toxin [Sulfurimonas sp.]